MKKKKYPRYIYLLLVILAPLALGLPIASLLKDLVYLEIIYVLFGLLIGLLIVIRFRARDSVNFKKNRSVFEDKTTLEYKEFKKSQWFLFSLALVDFALSLIVFFIETL